MSLVLHGTPNSVQFPLADNFSFYIALFNANPSAATKLALIDSPVFIIQRLGDANSQVWGMYYMPIKIIILVSLSFLITRARHLRFKAFRLSMIGTASCLLLFALFYLRIQTCCTAEPRWLFDIWMFSIISDPHYDHVFWQNIYTQLSEHFTLIQFILSSTALIVLYLASYTNIFSRNKLDCD